MNEYEITYLSDPQLTDEVRNELDAAIDALIDGQAGSISFSEPNARRRLFYPIKKQLVGFARTINVTLDGAQVQTAREAIAKQVGVLRVSVLKTARRADVSAEILDEFYKRSAPAKTTTVVEKTKEKVKKDSKPVTMAEVEEKIEQALDEEVK